MTEDTNPKVIKAYCSSCEGNRNCEIVGEHVYSYTDGGVWGEKKWRILVCRGCDNIFFQTASIFSEDYDYYTNELGEDEQHYNETITYWPAPSKRPQPAWTDELYAVESKYSSLTKALNELYGALDADLPMLAGVAVRVCFDVCAEALEIDSDLTFSQKIKELVRAGQLGATAEQRITTAINAGHAATHRGWVPTPDDLRTLVDILETFIFDTIIEPSRKAQIDQRTTELGTRVPPKPKKQTSKGPAAGAIEGGQQD